jgi:hypothetical protein
MPDSIIKADNISSLSGGGVGFPDGNVSNPSIKFTNDGDTGLYRIDANKIGISTGGSKVGEIGSGYGGFTGNVIQVLNAVKTNAQDTSSTTFIDVTDLSLVITPKSIQNKILISVRLNNISNSAANGTWFNLLRNSTVVTKNTSGGLTDTIGSFGGGGGGGTTTDSRKISSIAIDFLDSPSSISAITYKIQMRVDGNTGAINRWMLNSDLASVSTLTLMEIAQ